MGGARPKNTPQECSFELLEPLDLQGLKWLTDGVDLFVFVDVLRTTTLSHIYIYIFPQTVLALVGVLVLTIECIALNA